LASMKFHVPELFTGLIGVAFIFAALWSSLKYKKEQAALEANGTTSLRKEEALH